jgi:tol-pal system protein YbgF
MKVRLAGLALVMLMQASSALAGPLEDAQARIAEMNQLMQSQNERIARLESQLQSQGLLNLLNQVAALKSEVATLRGTQEELGHRLDTADKRSMDLYVDLDERLKEVADRPVAMPTDSVRLQSSTSLVAAPVAPAAFKLEGESEAKDYEVGHSLIKAGKYKEAISAFQAFVSQYPSGSLAANALYWIGIAQVTGMSDFRGAADSYQRLLKEFPASPKVPDALLSLARTQIQMDQRELAKGTLNHLLVRHPLSKAAENGKKLLVTLSQ